MEGRSCLQWRLSFVANEITSALLLQFYGSIILHIPRQWKEVAVTIAKVGALRVTFVIVDYFYKWVLNIYSLKFQRCQDFCTTCALFSMQVKFSL